MKNEMSDSMNTVLNPYKIYRDESINRLKRLQESFSNTCELMLNSKPGFYDLYEQIYEIEQYWIRDCKQEVSYYERILQIQNEEKERQEIDNDNLLY